MGGIKRQLNVGGCASGHLSELLAVHRGDVLDVLAGSRSHPFAADPVLVAVLKLDLGSFLAGLDINSHGYSSGETDVFVLAASLELQRLRPRCNGAVCCSLTFR